MPSSTRELSSRGWCSAAPSEASAARGRSFIDSPRSSVAMPVPTVHTRPRAARRAALRAGDRAAASELQIARRGVLAPAKLISRVLVATLPALVLGLAWQGSRGLWEPDEVATRTSPGRRVRRLAGGAVSQRCPVSRQAAAALLERRREHEAARRQRVGRADSERTVLRSQPRRWSQRSDAGCGTGKPAG